MPTLCLVLPSDIKFCSVLLNYQCLIRGLEHSYPLILITECVPRSPKRREEVALGNSEWQCGDSVQAFFLTWAFLLIDFSCICSFCFFQLHILHCWSVWWMGCCAAERSHISNGSLGILKLNWLAELQLSDKGNGFFFSQKSTVTLKCTIKARYYAHICVSVSIHMYMCGYMCFWSEKPLCLPAIALEMFSLSAWLFSLLAMKFGQES